MKPADHYYITTAISYPNGAPHMGHAYEVIATDAIARFQRLSGKKVLFQTGTDEHGLKIAQAARAPDLSPREYVDGMVKAFEQMAVTFGISHDRFIRTTDADHYAASQELWRRMAAADDLYLDRYEGWYSVRDEAYYDETELVDATDASGAALRLSPPGYAGRMDDRGELVLPPVEVSGPPAGPLRRPEGRASASRVNEMRSFVAGGLRDLSVSRTSFDWGVPVPDAPGHVMYVWVDALTQLPDRCGLSRRLRRGRRERLVASRPARRRQGRGALSCGILARLPDVRQLATGQYRVRPRLRPRPRHQDVEGRSATSSRRSNWLKRWASTGCVGSCSATSRSARTATTATRRSSNAPTQTSPTASATSRSAHCRWSQRTAAASCPHSTRRKACPWRPLRSLLQAT